MSLITLLSPCSPISSRVKERERERGQTVIISIQSGSSLFKGPFADEPSPIARGQAFVSKHVSTIIAHFSRRKDLLSQPKSYTEALIAPTFFILQGSLLPGSSFISISGHGIRESLISTRKPPPSNHNNSSRPSPVIRLDAAPPPTSPDEFASTGFVCSENHCCCLLMATDGSGEEEKALI